MGFICLVNIDDTPLSRRPSVKRCSGVSGARRQRNLYHDSLDRRIDKYCLVSSLSTMEEKVRGREQVHF